jgi:hypothetical protein
VFSPPSFRVVADHLQCYFFFRHPWLRIYVEIGNHPGVVFVCCSCASQEGSNLSSHILCSARLGRPSQTTSLLQQTNGEHVQDVRCGGHARAGGFNWHLPSPLVSLTFAWRSPTLSVCRRSGHRCRRGCKRDQGPYDERSKLSFSTVSVKLVPWVVAAENWDDHHGTWSRRPRVSSQY